MMQAGWKAFRMALVLGVACLFLADGLSWLVLPGRFVLEVLGAAGPRLGRHAVLLSGVFYALTALSSSFFRREVQQPEVVFDLS
jgi:hypothetical protein